MHIRHLPYFAKELINLFYNIKNRYSYKVLKSFNKICRYKTCEYSDSIILQRDFIKFCCVCGDAINGDEYFTTLLIPIKLNWCIPCENISKIIRNTCLKRCDMCGSHMSNSDIKYEINKKTGFYSVKNIEYCSSCNISNECLHIKNSK